MRTFTFSRNRFICFIIAWFIFFSWLSAVNYNGFELLNIIGFISLAILPGYLTILNIHSKIKGLPFWGYVTLTVGFSLLELMVMGLLGNTFLPLAGITRPLDKPSLLLELYFLIGVLTAGAWMRIKDLSIVLKPYIFFDNLQDLILSLIPIIFVGLSILGAIRLNNGGSNILTMIMLGGMSIYFLILIYYSDKCGENVSPTALFFMALSLLFMTSFRGWFVTGHDIQVETQFFELTKNAGLWSIGASQDAYNACLSITILPTIFANLLSLADQYIFKFFFQIFFALCPVLVYLIGQNWTSRRISLMSAIYFMAFPTFFTDMPFIVRQEIAFVFFGLMLYLIFEPKLKLWTRRILFIIMGIGVILSHYSTTYTILVILGLMVLSRPLFTRLLKFFKRSNNTTTARPRITATMVGFLLILAFLWTSTITHTGGQLNLVIDQTISAVQDGFAGNNRSIDAISLLSITRVGYSQEFNEYIQNVVNPLRADSPSGTYFNASTYTQYSMSALNDETSPITSFGKFLDGLGINFTALSSLLAQLIAKLMEILAPLGIIYVLVDKKRSEELDDEIYVISLYCLIFIFLNLILPVLSVQYGVFRAMQQSLFVLGFFIVIASELVGKWLFDLLKLLRINVIKYSDSQIFPAILLLIFFFYSSAFLSQALGGNIPDLHLNNSGTYYDNYTTQGTEVAGIHWLLTTLSSEFPGSNIQSMIAADRVTTAKFQAIANIAPENDIFPGLVKKNSYVFLGEGAVKEDETSLSYNGDLLTYSYPIQFLDNNKNLIYNNGGSRVYQ